MANKNIPLDWVKNLNLKEREDFETHIRNAGRILRRLRELANDRISQVNREVISKRNYESPSWAFLQADANGEIRALEYILNLTDFIA